MNPNIARIRELLTIINEVGAYLQKSENPRIQEEANTIRETVTELVGFVPKDKPAEPTEPEPEPTDPDPPIIVTEPTLPARFVKRSGFTFELRTDLEVRRSITGDPVVPPGAVVVGMTPASRQQENRWMNGAMLNPRPSFRQGYDSRLLAQYSGGSYYGELDISRHLPITLQDGDSLVAIESPRQADTRPGVDRAAVLTCGIPPAGRFLRPPACGNTFQFYDFDEVLERASVGLPTRALPAGFPELGEVAANLENLWLDHGADWGSRYMHPREWMPDYGRGLSSVTGIAVAALTFDHPLRERLIAGVVQRGIDYAGWKTHDTNPSGAQIYMGAAAGHGNGRKSLVALAGYLTGDDRVLGSGLGKWSEEEQFFYVSGRDTSRGQGYTEADLGRAEWGTNPVRQPEKNEKAWGGDLYRQCCTMNALWGHAFLLSAMPVLRSSWVNADAFLEYAARYLETEGKLTRTPKPGGKPGEMMAADWQLAWGDGYSKTCLGLFIEDYIE